MYIAPLSRCFSINNRFQLLLFHLPFKKIVKIEPDTFYKSLLKHCIHQAFLGSQIRFSRSPITAKTSGQQSSRNFFLFAKQAKYCTHKRRKRIRSEGLPSRNRITDLALTQRGRAGEFNPLTQSQQQQQLFLGKRKEL